MRWAFDLLMRGLFTLPGTTAREQEALLVLISAASVPPAVR